MSRVTMLVCSEEIPKLERHLAHAQTFDRRVLNIYTALMFG